MPRSRRDMRDGTIQIQNVAVILLGIKTQTKFQRLIFGRQEFPEQSEF